MSEAKKGLKHIVVLAFPFGSEGPPLFKGCFKWWCEILFKDGLPDNDIFPGNLEEQIEYFLKVTPRKDFTCIIDIE
ncbi:hypothetical protein NC651_016458 [Populus alba x Populus x berolinensis]|nr:hypothetical protein NC651_016458 [Populus alba x Populus x berolinensis]